MALVLVTVGYWLLFNVIFHYYMAVTTPPGVPPDVILFLLSYRRANFIKSMSLQGVLIVEAVSICKKCIAPKPPRTHHCSVCNKCILKMDHHCRKLLAHFLLQIYSNKSFEGQGKLQFGSQIFIVTISYGSHCRQLTACSPTYFYYTVAMNLKTTLVNFGKGSWKCCFI